MKTYEHDGIYGKGLSYVMENIEDFDEYEKILKKEDGFKYNPNFYLFKDDFQKYIGKIWRDTKSTRYVLNGNPVYSEYKIIALEDDNPNADWYWVVQNVDDDRDIKYELANDSDFYKDII